ncbi:hypothetical protein [Halobaculum sp. D14]|uniref:hypothetical protein n=1 Tax=Halobaculum sp. D14 TaxID=3421642 RepID=UPI003EB8B5C9
MLMALAFIIFGRKVRSKDYGPAYPGYCNRCENDVHFHPCKWRSWAHVFWIPLIPWFGHRELVCPICGSSVDLDKPAFRRAKQLSQIGDDIENGKATQEEFRAALKDFEVVSGFDEFDVRITEVPPGTEGEPPETGE